MKEKLSQRYALETVLLRLERQQAVITEDIKQAKYDIRCKNEALLSYEGGLRRFLDQLSGKREEKAEALRRDLRHAENLLSTLLREQEALRQECTELQKELQSLPSLDILRKANELEWAALEARYCAEALSPLLEGTKMALLEYRELMQGSRPDVLSPTAQQEIYTAPNLWGEQCQPLVERLKIALDILETPFAPGGYFDSPASYLVTVAAKHNRLDRVNQALDQTQDIMNLTRKILGE